MRLHSRQDVVDFFESQSEALLALFDGDELLLAQNMTGFARKLLNDLLVKKTFDFGDPDYDAYLRDKDRLVNRLDFPRLAEMKVVAEKLAQNIDDLLMKVRGRIIEILEQKAQTERNVSMESSDPNETMSHPVVDSEPQEDSQPQSTGENDSAASSPYQTRGPRRSYAPLGFSDYQFSRMIRRADFRSR